MENLVGQTIAGYELLRELGHGAMGVVYKALEKNLHRTVALKILSPKLARNQAEIEGFYKEARAAAKINHPNVVTIFTVGSEGDRHFISMEYVQGRTLSRAIQRVSHLKVNEALEIAKCVADALEAAHRQKILHRDIKPQNIMLDEQNRPRVMDFGIARIRDTANQAISDTAEWIGTPAYLSPEQCLGKPTDHRSDIYALGVTLFEMLAGRTPYVLTDRSMLKQMIIESPIPSIRRFNKDVPYSVVKILEKALAKDPVHRYGSCFEMREDLDRALNGLDVAAGPSSEVESATTSTGYNLRAVTPSPGHAPTPLPAAPKTPVALKLAKPPTPVSTPLSTETVYQPKRVGFRPVLRWILVAALVAGAATLGGMYHVRSQNPESLRLSGHRGDVAALALSADGKTLVTGGADATVRIWNIPEQGGGKLLDKFVVPSERPVRTLVEHEDTVNAVAISPDGRQILSGGADRDLRLWDAATGKTIKKLEGHVNNVWSLAFSPDGASAASAGADAVILLWDLESGKIAARLKGNEALIKSLAYSPDGRTLASGGGDQLIRLWDIKSRALSRKLEGHGGAVVSLQFSPTGNRLLSASWDKTIRLWDLDSGKTIRTLKGHAEDVSSAHFSPDAKRIVSSSGDDSTRIWDAASGSEIARFVNPKGDALNALILRDGRRAVVAGAGGTVRIWNLPE